MANYRELNNPTLTNYCNNPTFEGFHHNDSLPTTVGAATKGWYIDSAANLTASVLNTIGFRSTNGLRIQLNATSGVAGTVRGVLRAVSSVDRSKSLTLSFNYRTGTGYTANDVAVTIRDTTNNVTITPGVTNIPKSTDDNTFTTTFVGSTSSAYEVRFTPIAAPTSASTNTLEIDNLFIGPLDVVQGVPVTEWQSYTPTIAGSGTTSNEVFRWARSGSSMLISGSSIMGTTTATPMYFTLPTGYTIDTTKLAAGNRAKMGDANRLTSASTSPDITGIYLALYFNGTNTDRIHVANTIVSGGYTTSNTNSMFSSGEVFVFDAIVVPIAEWAGSTVSLTNSRVEYAYYNGTWNAANDGVSFGYGPAGGTIGGTLTATRVKAVRFLTPIQSTDRLVLQFSDSGTKWFEMPTDLNTATVAGFLLDTAGTTNAGVKLRPGSGATTDIEVLFAQYQFMEPDAGGLVNWTSGFWRVAKSSNPLAIGEDSRTLVGVQTGTDAAAGYVGEYMVARVTSATNFPTSTQWGDATNFTLTAGDWDVTFVLDAEANGSTTTQVSMGISSTTGNSTTGLQLGDNQLGLIVPTAATDSSSDIANYRVSITASTIYYGKVQATYAAGNPRYRCRLSARRIR